MPEPPPRRGRTLRDVIAADPAARRRVGRAYAELMGALLVAIAGLGVLIAWWIHRRGGRVRARLGPGRPAEWPETPPREPDDP